MTTEQENQTERKIPQILKEGEYQFKTRFETYQINLRPTGLFLLINDKMVAYFILSHLYLGKMVNKKIDLKNVISFEMEED